MATLKLKGQGVETKGLIRGGRKGDQCYQKYNLVEDCIHSEIDRDRDRSEKIIEGGRKRDSEREKERTMLPEI